MPESGPIYLDAYGFIYSVEHIEPYRTLIEPVWQRASTVQLSIVTGELSVTETWSNHCETATNCYKGSSAICSAPTRYSWCQQTERCGKPPPQYAPLQTCERLTHLRPSSSMTSADRGGRDHAPHPARRGQRAGSSADRRRHRQHHLHGTNHPEEANVAANCLRLPARAHRVGATGT